MHHAECVKRMTIMRSEDTAARLTREARRRGVSIATIVRDALHKRHSSD
jgi:hypothetical protein